MRRMGMGNNVTLGQTSGHHPFPHTCVLRKDTTDIRRKSTAPERRLRNERLDETNYFGWSLGVGMDLFAPPVRSDGTPAGTNPQEAASRLVHDNRLPSRPRCRLRGRARGAYHPGVPATCSNILPPGIRKCNSLQVKPPRNAPRLDATLDAPYLQPSAVLVP
jgi:hypothetical protein